MGINLDETDLIITGFTAVYRNGVFTPAELLDAIRQRATELLS